jgi:hypothetical protein
VSTEKKSNRKIGFWDAVQNVLIYSMDKGQAPLIVGSIIIILLIVKLPESYLMNLIDRVLNRLTAGFLVGYGLCFISVIGWYINVRFVLVIKDKEIQRLSNERNHYQQKCIGNMESSQ